MQKTLTPEDIPRHKLCIDVSDNEWELLGSYTIERPLKKAASLLWDCGETVSGNDVNDIVGMWASIQQRLKAAQSKVLYERYLRQQ